jgi:LAO/AO transport system kinase
VVNKADGPHVRDAKRAARELAGALRLVTPPSAPWTPPVLTCSAVEGTGLDDVWATVLQHRSVLGEAGLARRRAAQQVDWMWALVRDELLGRLRSEPTVRQTAADAADEVRDGRLTPVLAARRVLDAFDAPRDGGAAGTSGPAVPADRLPSTG